MSKKTKAEKENPNKALSEEKEEEEQEIEALKNQNLALQELHNLKDEAYHRVQVLNSLNRIALAIENLELGEEEESEKESDEEETEE